MKFQEALEYLNNGHCMRRTCWIRSCGITIKDNIIYTYVCKNHKCTCVDKGDFNKACWRLEDFLADDWIEFTKFYDYGSQIDDRTAWQNI